MIILYFPYGQASNITLTSTNVFSLCFKVNVLGYMYLLASGVRVGRYCISEL